VKLTVRGQNYYETRDAVEHLPQRMKSSAIRGIEAASLYNSGIVTPREEVPKFHRFLHVNRRREQMVKERRHRSIVNRVTFA